MAYRSNRRGMGEYDKLSQPYTWMYYPRPYGFADPVKGLKVPPTFIAPARSMGLGSCGGGCGCGGKCGGRGMGAVDLSLSGTGIADAALGAVGMSPLSIPNWMIYGGAAALFLIRK